MVRSRRTLSSTDSINFTTFARGGDAARHGKLVDGAVLASERGRLHQGFPRNGDSGERTCAR